MADSLYFINGSTLTSIGNAIRSVKGTTAAIPVSNFASEISKFSSGSAPVYHTVTFKGANNETLATYQVEHGKSITYTGKTPTSSSTLFYRWRYYVNGSLQVTTSTINNVTSDINVTAEMMADSIFESDFSYQDYDIHSQIISCNTYADIMVIPRQRSNGLLIDGLTLKSNYFSSATTSILIPDSIEHMDGSSFRNCTNLKDVYFTGTKEIWLERIATVYSYYGNQNLFLTPRIHTTDGCIINS